MQLAKSLALAGLMSTGLAQNTGKVKIMYLGDSITEITCWRANVWDMLGAANLTGSVTMVGSMTDNPENCKATTPNFDLHHEGHSGWLAIDIANSYLTGWLKSTPADIVQFMLGTNDVVRGHSTSDILAAYSKMVTEMRTANPKMKIIVDKVIPLSIENAPVEALNTAIPAWVTSENSTASPIYIADCSDKNGFTTSMLRDGVHPNAQGDTVMAKNIGPQLIQHIQNWLAGI